MNKHTRIAFMIAPILAVIGYIAADYYKENQANDDKIIKLVPVSHCDVINESCILKAGDFEVNFFSIVSFTQKILKILSKNNNGKIINISSNAAKLCSAGRSGYA
ncbi:MAG: SDR family NAD(P)-dependent oxidoreductase, partial [Alteromonadaceae bacterium]